MPRYETLVDRHVPTRSCFSCGRKAPKRDLIRVVRTFEGKVAADPTGKSPGRGAYLCRIEECWRQGLKRTRIDHILRGKFSTQDRESLILYYEEILKPVGVGSNDES